MFAIAMRRCCTGARRQDETSAVMDVSASVSPRPGSSTGGRRRPMDRRCPYHPPWTPAGKGSKGWKHRTTEAVLPIPGEGSERPVRGKQRGQWPSGRNRAVRRSPSVEPPTQHSAPTPPASLCPPAGTSQQNKHTSTPHPEPLSEYMIRAMWRRGIKRDTPSVQPRQHTRPASSARSALALLGGAQSSMAVRGSGTSMSVCAANSSEQGEGGERGFPPEGVLVVVPRRTST